MNEIVSGKEMALILHAHALIFSCEAEEIFFKLPLEASIIQKN